MLKVLQFVRERLLTLILVSMALGLANGATGLMTNLKGAVLPILLVMVYPMMINIKMEEVAGAFRDIRPVLLSLMINFIFMPVLTFGISKVFFQSDPMFATGSTSLRFFPLVA